MSKITINLSDKYNKQRQFDLITIEKLQNYVYALRDPRDKKIFYVGKGTGNRVFDHFKEAENCLKKEKTASSKVLRILDIWKNEMDVEYVIIAHGKSEEEAFVLEAATIDALNESQNGIVLNDQSGHHSTLITKDNIKTFSAQPVNPNKKYDTVFVFPIHNQLRNGVSVYDATRYWWQIKEEYTKKKNNIAVGISNSICLGAFNIKHWEYNKECEKYGFSGDEMENSELLNTNWQRIISIAKGYWQWGNYLIVSFDGKGNFKVKRGASDNNDRWIPCIN